MKKLMMLLLLCLAMVPASAQQTKSYLMVYKTDGSIDTLLLNNVRSLDHSRFDMQGVEQPDLTTLRITMVGGERVYPLATIDHLVMPRFGRIISFLGTTDTATGAKNGRRPWHTAVHGDFPSTIGDAVNYGWTSGDRLWLPNGASSDALTASTQNGFFQFRSDSLVADHYVVYYPGQNATAYNQVTIPTLQTQTKPNNSNHLGTSGDCGTALATRTEAVSEKESPDYTFSLDHKTAVICFLPHVDTLRTIVLKQIGVKANKTIAGAYTLSPTGLALNDGTGSDSIALATTDFPIPGIKGTKAAQDSVASYLVVAPQDARTTLTVYYRVYDTATGLDTTIVKHTAYKQLKGASVYTCTQSIPVRFLLAAVTDSVQWAFGQPAKLYGSVNLPVNKVGFIWGYNRNLNDQTKEQTITMDYAKSFSRQAVDNVGQRAYYYRAYAQDGNRTVWGKVKKFGMERLAVDLGLSVKWSNINLGATTGEDDGDYYAWAELKPKTKFGWSDYQYYQNNTWLPLPADISGNPAYDAVTATWGSCWRMPTYAEYQELTRLKWESKTVEGKNVWKITGKLTDSDNDTILIPKAGFISYTTPFNYGNNSVNWTGTNYNSDKAKAGEFSNTYGTTTYKYYGLTIRPVFDSNIETAKGQYLFIRTDNISYDDGQTTLTGTMRGLDDVVTPITEGFVVGTATDVTLDADTKAFNTEVAATQNGSYSIQLTDADLDKMDLGATYYARAYLTFDGNSYYGDALKMDAMTITTDSTDWQVNRTSANLYGSASGISAEGAKSIDIGFVVGTTADVTTKTALQTLVCDSTVNGRFACTLADVPMQQLYYRAFIRRGGHAVYGEPHMMGLEMVDLGLPSGTRWANINVGAQAPVDYGNYYAWGETKPYADKNYWIYNYDPKGDGTNKYDDIGTDIGGSRYDAAQMNWQGAWRMPTHAEAQELFDNCTFTKTTLLGTTVWQVTSKLNGNSIYIPVAGRYSGTSFWNASNTRFFNWTSTATAGNSSNADYFAQGSGNSNGLFNLQRYYGLTVRPVYHYNMTTSEGYHIQLTTDSVEWQPGKTTATLYGYLVGLGNHADATVSGFVYGTTSGLKVGDSGTQTLVYSAEGDDRVARGRYSCQVTGVKDNTTYYYKAYVKVGNTYYYGEEHEFGREWVDLGLTSGTRWASINLGTGSIDQQGDRYAWGETTARTTFTKDTYSAATVTGDIAGSANDAAHTTWGGLATMPTEADLQELLSQCTWSEVTRYGLPMVKVTGTNGQSIYLLKGQPLWSSTLNTGSKANSSTAFALATSGTPALAAVARYSGLYLRAVKHASASLDDGTEVLVSTVSSDWQVGQTTVSLRGSVSTSATVDGLVRGFLVGYNSNLTAGAQDVTELTATASDTDDSFTATTTYKKDTTYYYRAFVKQGGKYYYGSVRRYGLQLVDMGDGVMWASINIGAQYDALPGDRFAWGETSTKGSFTEQTYKYYDRGVYQPMRVDISGTSFDAARKQWGGDWRLPTLAEMQALLKNCTWTWTTVDGQTGYTVTAKNGNTIFLPAAGYQNGAYLKQVSQEGDYWTSTIGLDGTASSLNATDKSHKADTVGRYRGLSIRPVITVGSKTSANGGITGGHRQGGSTTTDQGNTGDGNVGTGDNGGSVGD